MYNFLKYDIEENILTITLTNLGKLNAFNPVMCSEIIDAVNCASEDDEIKAIIFTGEGKGFCSGADLSSGEGTFDYSKIKPEDYRDIAGPLSLAMYDCKKPIIGAINGAAIGIGVTMTLPMDVRIASTKAKFGFVFVTRGIIPEAASSWFLPRIVGLSKAVEWVCTGRIFDANEALESHLISRIVEPELLLETAREIAKQFAANAPVSVTMTRQLFLKNAGLPSPYEAHLQESKVLYWISDKPDKAEGILSFMEKREPEYTMKPSEDIPDFYPWWKND